MRFKKMTSIFCILINISSVAFGHQDFFSQNSLFEQGQALLDKKINAAEFFDFVQKKSQVTSIDYLDEQYLRDLAEKVSIEERKVFCPEFDTGHCLKENTKDQLMSTSTERMVSPEIAPSVSLDLKNDDSRENQFWLWTLVSGALVTAYLLKDKEIQISR